MLAVQNETLDKYGFDQFIAGQIKMKNLQKAIADIDEKINLVHEAIANHILRTPEKAEEIKNVYAPRMELLERKKHDQVLYVYIIINTNVKYERCTVHTR